MNNITMLMTGVLMTEQLSSSNLLNLSAIQLDKDMQNQSYQLISEAKAASSKAMRLSHNLRIFPLRPKSQSQKSRITKIRKIFTKDLDKLTKVNYTQDLRKDLDKLTKVNYTQDLTNEFSKRKGLTAKQRRDKLVFTKSQKASFINREKLISEQNSNDIVIASSQSFTNQRLPNLGFSSSGIAVRVLQRLLVANGYAVKVDGYFGPLTESAIKAFQEQQDLTVDGIVGTQTWDGLTMYSEYQRLGAV
jgi:murein L,D-transpeptidase YcbB/YkuD